ncbi:MAG: CHRD domain-containing protein, partial [Gemmatimonas sp.]
SSGTGTFIATLDTSTNVFTYDVSFSGLTSNVTLGHIHGPSLATAIASPILNFATLPGANFTLGATTGTAHGSTLLTAATQINSTVNGDSLKKLLFAGLTYANIHTTLNGGGEIRGQITKQ